MKLQFVGESYGFRQKNRVLFLEQKMVGIPMGLEDEQSGAERYSNRI